MAYPENPEGRNTLSDPTGHEFNNTIQLLKNTERPLLVVFIDGWQRIR
jgi:hypothetical protein